MSHGCTSEACASRCEQALPAATGSAALRADVYGTKIDQNDRWASSHVVKHEVDEFAAQVVFDGGALPAKLITHQQRRARRAEKLEKASMLLAEGNAAAASSAFCATIDVTCGTHKHAAHPSTSCHGLPACASFHNASIPIRLGKAEETAV